MRILFSSMRGRPATGARPMFLLSWADGVRGNFEIRSACRVSAVRISDSDCAAVSAVLTLVHA